MGFNQFISYITWNPHREAFTIPFFDISIMWYGVLFATGFILGYFILIPVAEQFFNGKQPGDPANARKLAYNFTDRLVWYVMLGTLIGARLGYVIFYDLSYYLENPLEIIMVRKGGLASHGGTIGVITALYLFYRWNKSRYPGLTFIYLIDMLCIPAAITGACIRIGNFINQEIVGISTTVPWGVIFGHPAEGGEIVPRHPVQLYEAGIYIATFFLLMSLWRKYSLSLKPGSISGIFFISVFGSRFFIEYLKMQGQYQVEGDFQIAQYLSIPFVFLGIGLLCWHRVKPCKCGEKNE